MFPGASTATMSARSDPLAFGNNYTIAPHVFSDAAFSVQALLASLTQDALSTGASVRAAAEGPAAEAAATAMVEKGHKLLSVLDKYVLEADISPAGSPNLPPPQRQR